MKRILILESNEAFAGELANYFSTQKDCEVCGVTGDGEEGIKLLEKFSPNVAVISLFLKNLDGFGVLEEAKRSGRKTDFIVLGNFSDDAIINRAIALGARYYFMKPVSAAPWNSPRGPSSLRGTKSLNAAARGRSTSASPTFSSPSASRRISRGTTTCARASRWR